MAVNDVVGKVRFFRQARVDIRNDKHLSPQGIERASKNLEESIALFRPQALSTLQQAWVDVRQLYNDAAETRAELEKAESERWNYHKLLYETQAVTTRLKAFNNFAELTSWLEKETASGNLERRRAVLEHAPAVLRSRFGSDGGENVARTLERQLALLLDTPELSKLRQLEDSGGRAVLELVKATQEVSDFFEPSHMWGENDFSRLLSNVRISTKVNPEDFQHFQTTTIEFVEPEPVGV